MCRVIAYFKLTMVYLYLQSQWKQYPQPYVRRLFKKYTFVAPMWLIQLHWVTLESWCHWGQLSAGKWQVFMVILLGAQMDVHGCARLARVLNRKSLNLFFLLYRVNAELQNESQGLALTPPRGWNSYNSFSWIISEEEFLDNARFVSQNLLKFGYEVKYLIINTKP